MTVIELASRPTETIMANDDDKRYIYFNPNFCINNINVKELVKRANVVGLETPNQPTTAAHIFKVPKVPEKRQISYKPNYTVHLVDPAPQAPPASVPQQSHPQTYQYEEYYDPWDPNHPWYPRNLRYPENLLSLAADYVHRPDQPPRCRLPPLSKKELAKRMNNIFQSGNLANALRLQSQKDKFVKYLRLLNDQIDFDSLHIDTRRQTYAQCRQKRAKMLKLGVNEFHFVNEDAVDELYARQKIIRQQMKAFTSRPLPENLDTSLLTPNQRRFIFKQHVLAKGRRTYVKFNAKFKVSNVTPNTTPDEFTDMPPLIPIRTNTHVGRGQKRIIPPSMKYVRIRDPVHQDCRLYLKTGKCKFGTRCVGKHDPSKLPTGLKKKFARSQPKSVFSINNVPALPRRPVTMLTRSQPSSSTSLPSSSDFRFVKKAALGSSRVKIHKKIVNKALKWKRRTAEQKLVDCLFYIRKGVCHFGDRCSKRHDPAKVNLCTKFIFGNRCRAHDCPFQHKLIRDKMPLCLYFIAGQCGKDNCPFLHIKMGTSVPVCDKFLKGYCERGSNCLKRHTRDCEVYFESGLCANLECKLHHEKQLRNRTISFDSIDNVIDQDRPYYDGDDFIPVRGRVEDEFSQDILRLMDSDVESIQD